MRVQGNNSLGKPVQHGFPVLRQSRDLPRFEPERLPLDPPGEQPRPEKSQYAGDSEIDRQVRRRTAQPLQYGRSALTDHHGPDVVAERPIQLAVLVPAFAQHRNLGNQLRPIVAPQLTRPAATVRDCWDTECELRSDQRRIGCRDHLSVGVRDRDRGDAGLREVGLQRGRKHLRRRRVANVEPQRGVRRQLLGQQGDPAAFDPVERGGRLGERHRSDGDEHDDHDRQLQHEQLPGQGRTPSQPRHSHLLARIGLCRMITAPAAKCHTSPRFRP